MITKLLTTTCAAAVLLPASALAADAQYVYSAAFEGSGTYEHLEREGSDGGPVETRHTKASFRWLTEYDEVRFDAKTKDIVGEASGDMEAQVEGTSTRDVVWEEGEIHEACRGSESPLSLNTGVLAEDPDGIVPLEPAQSLVVRPFDELWIHTDCDHGGARIDLGRGEGRPGDGIYDAWIDVPREAVGMGKIVLNVGPTAHGRDPERCPGRNESTERCTFDWTGTVTLYKRGAEGTAGEAERARLGRGATKTKFDIRCSQGCTGTAKVRARGRTVTTKRFTVAPGVERSTVSVPLSSRSARRAVRRGGAKLVVTVDGRAGAQTLPLG